MVNAYDSKTPINQLGNINVPDASTLVIQVWDKTLIKSIETAIIESKFKKKIVNKPLEAPIISLAIEYINAFLRFPILTLVNE